MKTLTFDSREAWLLARKGKITGTRAKDIIVKRGTSYKKGFYELIAERIALPPTEENPMDRGTRLESEAIERFVKETGKKVNTDLVIWTRDDNESIAFSPDGYIGKKSAKEAVECKCLSSASHIEAFLTKEVPDEYKDQTIQAFVVNDKLQTLYVVFYDPRVPCKDFFTIRIDREAVKEKVAEYLAYEQMILSEVTKIVTELTF